MSDLNLFIAVVVGIAARLTIPIFITMAAVYLLRKLDAHWESEGRNPPATVAKPACWEINGCPPERSRECVGRTSPLPCWQAQRTANGYLREQCLSCKVFLKAPVPTLAYE